ncbi:hypothetical protein AMTR_s00007p00082080 [Amborella trichopoda]|uniref:Pentacotripeptide-repeat region of PRORP domain-containing protein n=1 Tax=Amborella trichopoda TaxID=13333 RepID=W1PCA9_AMBTC|nr:hypothetical protein AMTR_s00007p00082080 [Amborella trichopoda]
MIIEPYNFKWVVSFIPKIPFFITQPLLSFSTISHSHDPYIPKNPQSTIQPSLYLSTNAFSDNPRSPSLLSLRHGNHLIALHARSGRIDDARGVADKMPIKDVVTWTTLLNAFALHSMVADARKLFDEMPQRNQITWNSMLSCYVRHSMFHDADTLFESMPCRDVVSWTIMLQAYASAKCVLEARRLFDKMPERNVVSWTVMIGMYCDSGQVDEARRLFDEMPERNEVSWTAMVSGYMRSGLVCEARRLFDEMPGKSVISYNSMLSGYARESKIDEAWEIFHEMPEKNTISWNTMIGVLAKSGLIEEARLLFNEMPFQNFLSTTNMISSYFSVGKVEEGKLLFDGLQEKGTITWNAMISGYEQNGLPLEALIMLNQMHCAGMKWNSSTVTSALSACGSLAVLGMGKQIHKQAISMGLSSNIYAGSSLIDMYFKCGCIDHASEVFNYMSNPDLVSWNTMISGLAYNGHGKSALKIYSLVDEGLHYFELMRTEEGLEPRTEHYGCVIDALGRAGWLTDAYALIRLMPFEPEDSTWASLLGACRNHGNLELGLLVAERLRKLGSSNPGIYILLSNVYAEAGRWGDVGFVREEMRERCMVKEPGVSWIEITGTVHRFLAGEETHPQAPDIHVVLVGLSKVMRVGEL